MGVKIGRATSMFQMYSQLIHVKGESALGVVLVVKIEGRSLKRHMFERASLASRCVLESRSMINVQPLKSSIVKILCVDG